MPHHERAGHGASLVSFRPSFASSYAAAIRRCASCSLAGSTPTSARMSRTTATGGMIVMPYLALLRLRRQESPYRQLQVSPLQRLRPVLLLVLLARALRSGARVPELRRDPLVLLRVRRQRLPQRVRLGVPHPTARVEEHIAERRPAVCSPDVAGDHRVLPRLAGRPVVVALARGRGGPLGNVRLVATSCRSSRSRTASR